MGTGTFQQDDSNTTRDAATAGMDIGRRLRLIRENLDSGALAGDDGRRGSGEQPWGGSAALWLLIIGIAVLSGFALVVKLNIPETNISAIRETPTSECITIADCTAAINANPQNASAFRIRGDQYLQQGKFVKAVADFDMLLLLSSEDIEGYLGRGKAYVALLRGERALQDFDRALEMDPQEARGYYGRGTALFALGSYAKANEAFTEAISRNAEYAAAYLDRGVARYNLSQYDDAVNDFDETIRLMPQSATAHYDRGVVNLARGQSAQAAEDFGEAVRLDPGGVAGYVGRIAAFNSLGEGAKEQKDLRRMKELKLQSAQDFVVRGRALVDRGELQDAVADLSAAILRDPSIGEAYVQRARAYNALDQGSQAQMDKDKALELGLYKTYVEQRSVAPSSLEARSRPTIYWWY